MVPSEVAARNSLAVDIYQCDEAFAHGTTRHSPDLAVLNPPGGAAVVACHARRKGAVLEKARLINHANVVLRNLAKELADSLIEMHVVTYWSEDVRRIRLSKNLIDTGRVSHSPACSRV